MRERGSQPVLSVEWKAPVEMKTAWPAATAKGLPSSTICSPWPASMYRISSASGWFWRVCPLPGRSTTCSMLIAELSVFAFATSGLMRPQSKVWVGIEFGSTSFDGICSSLLMGAGWLIVGSALQGLEASHRLRDRHLCGQSLHAGRPEEADHAMSPLEHVSRVRRLRDRSAVAEHHHIRVDRRRRVPHRLDERYAVVECLRRVRADRALGRHAHLRNA